MWTNKGELYKLIVKQKGHFYLCGEVGMAEDVAYTLGRILKEQGLMTVDHAREYIEEMKVGRVYWLVSFKQNIYQANNKLMWPLCELVD